MNLATDFFKRYQHGLFVAALLLFFIALFFRNSAGMYPGVLDEFYYNQFSRLKPLAESTYGNYLYLLIYRATNFCGNGFLSCAYFLNTLFYVASAIPLYAIARRICSFGLSVWIIFLILLDPFNYWTGFFMAEALYFLAFWIFIWSLLRIQENSKPWHWFLSGVALGITALVKVHALFLLPAALVYILFWAKSQGHSRQFVVRSGALFITGALLTKLLIGFLIVGLPGLTLFGVYGGMFNQSANALAKLTAPGAVSAAAENPYSAFAVLMRDGRAALWANVLPLFIVFGPAIAAALASLWQRYGETKKNRELALPLITMLAVVALAFSFVLICTILLFQLTLIVLAMGQVEIFWRYYAFALPLFLLFAAANLSHPVITCSWIGRSIIGVCILGLTAFGISRAAGTAWISIELSPTIFYITAGLSMFATSLWIWRARLGLGLFIWLFIPWIVIISNIEVYRKLHETRMKPNDTMVGMLINGRVTAADLSKLVMVQDAREGNYFPQMMEGLFFNTPSITYLQIKPDQLTFDLASTPKDKDWVLLMGNHTLTGEALNQTHMDYLSFGNTTLFGGHGSFAVDFTKNQWPGLINEQSGLFNPPEVWGAWSISDKVVLKFTKPLPRKFDLIITARSFGPNLNQDFLIELGKNSLPVRFESLFETKQLRFDNPHKLSQIEIIIPKPTSPASLGQGDDKRLLGIGLKEFIIQW